MVDFLIAWVMATRVGATEESEFVNFFNSMADSLSDPTQFVNDLLYVDGFVW